MHCRTKSFLNDKWTHRESLVDSRSRNFKKLRHSHNLTKRSEVGRKRNEKESDDDKSIRYSKARPFPKDKWLHKESFINYRSRNPRERLALESLIELTDKQSVTEYVSDICAKVAVKVGERFFPWRRYKVTEDEPGLKHKAKDIESRTRAFPPTSKHPIHLKFDNEDISMNIPPKCNHSAQVKLGNKDISRNIVSPASSTLNNSEDSSSENMDQTLGDSSHGADDKRSSEENHENDAFQDVGMTPDTIKSLSKSNISSTTVFESSQKTKRIIIQLPSEWKNLPVLNKNGYRSLGGDWSNFFANILSKHNSFCVWGFNLNFVKKIDSRKKNSPYFRTKAKCTMEKCSSTAYIEIKDGERMKHYLNFQEKL